MEFLSWSSSVGGALTAAPGQGPAALGVHGPPLLHGSGGAGHCGPYGLWHFGLRIKIGEKVDGGVAGLPVS